MKKKTRKRLKNFNEMNRKFIHGSTPVTFGIGLATANPSVIGVSAFGWWYTKKKKKR